MQEVTGTGKTIEEAIEQGLLVLGAARDEVEVSPLEAGRRGFLGFLGRRDAKVKVSVRPEDRIRVRVLIRNVLHLLGLEATPEVEESDNGIVIRLGEEASVLIGYHGQTLDALQYLASRIINNDREKWKKVTIDIDNYRDRREGSLQNLAERLAGQAVKEGRDQRTEPLSAQDRRTIHMTLRDHPKVTTFSVGNGGYRRVIVSLREGVPERQDRPRPHRGRSKRGRGSNGAGASQRVPRRSRGTGRRNDPAGRNRERSGGKGSESNS